MRKVSLNFAVSSYLYHKNNSLLIQFDNARTKTLLETNMLLQYIHLSLSIWIASIARTTNQILLNNITVRAGEESTSQTIYFTIHFVS